MNFRRVIYIHRTDCPADCARGIRLQAPDTSQQASGAAKAVTKKAKRAAKDTGDQTGRAAHPATDTRKKSREAKNGGRPGNLNGEAGGILHRRNG